MDLMNVCRTCLRIPKYPINLLEDNETLLHRINSIMSLKIEIGHGLPSNICEECFSSINYIYNFQKLVEHTDYDLKSRLQTLEQTNGLIKPTKTKSTDSHLMAECRRNSIERINIKSELNGDNTKMINSHKTRHNIAMVNNNNLQNQKIHNCSRCDAIFLSRNRLAMHRVQSHMPKLICNICGAAVREYNFRRHMSIHSAPVSCTVCGKLLKNKNSLKCHQRTHKKRKYFCKICGKGYVYSYEYKRHCSTHIGRNRALKLKECSVCGKKVAELNRHMLIHTGERPYVCPYCNKGFQQPFGLKMHIRQHTNERPYVCEHCGSAFPQIASLNTHLKRKHKIHKT